ncbi:MAG: hypothetical protein CSA70_01890 [Rhodobacterales bacterium]|nr:MAG: hypothetical protein CSA70_01890 [Rhodobacterales bacterium]
MKFRRFGIVGSAILLLLGVWGGAMQAGTREKVGTGYLCRMHSRTGNWIAPDILIVDNRKTGKLYVSDEVILAFKGKAVEGVVSQRGANRIAFTWTFGPVVDGRKMVVEAVKYRASLDLNTKAVRVIVQPDGKSRGRTGGHVDNNSDFRGTGSCSTFDAVAS